MAILWHEMWHEGLEEASRLYFGERNVKGMFAVLEPLHAMMERGPQTLKETSFNQVCDFSEVADVFRCSRFLTAFGRAFSFNCLNGSLFTTGLWPGFDGGTGLVQEVHALWKCQRLDAGLGPLLSRVQTHLKTTPSGEQNIAVVLFFTTKNRHYTETRTLIRLI